MIQRKKRKHLLLAFLLLLTMAFIVGCGNKSKEGKKENSTEKVSSTAKETKTPSATEKSKDQVTNDSTAKDEKPTKAVKRMVDGYDIGPATSGPKLKDLYKKYFTIGLAMCGSGTETSSVKSKALNEILKYHANNTTITNLLKPSYLLDQNGSIGNIENGIKTPAVKFDTITEDMDWCKANNIKVRGHVLVWHAQTPDWFFCKDYDASQGYVDRDTMLLRMESYIKQVLEYTQKNYPGVIYCWDVVNEAVETGYGSYETKTGFNIRTKMDDGSGKLIDNPWYKVVGADYVEKAFEYARKYAAKDVKLYYNDYSAFVPAKTDKICALLSYLKKKGLVDGMGMQCCLTPTYPGIYAGKDDILTEMKKYAAVGVEMQFTELTIQQNEDSPEAQKKQAERAKNLFTLMLQLDTDNGGPCNLVNVTMFGIMDQYLFYDPSNDIEFGRIFDGNMQPKPSFYSIRSVGENAKNIKPIKTFTPLK